MPELPEVETVRRGLEQFTLGQEIRGGEVLLSRSLAYPFLVAEFWEQVTRARFEAWERRGKYLLARLVRGEEAAGWFGCHLRMTGQLLWVDESERRSPYTRIVFRCGEGKELRFVDIRTFGRVWSVPPGVEPKTIMTGLGRLGPEPFDPQFTPTYLHQRLQKGRRPLKTALLDQSLVAGLGNIYADEVLFFFGWHPLTPGDRLTLADCQTLHQHIQQTLTQAIAEGGTSFRDYRQVTGINGNYGGIAQVYGRRGEPCRQCGTAIAKLKLGGRSAHFCPQCQPLSP